MATQVLIKNGQSVRDGGEVKGPGFHTISDDKNAKEWHKAGILTILPTDGSLPEEVETAVRIPEQTVLPSTLGNEKTELLVQLKAQSERILELETLLNESHQEKAVLSEQVSDLTKQVNDLTEQLTNPDNDSDENQDDESEEGNEDSPDLNEDGTPKVKNKGGRPPKHPKVGDA